MSAGPAALLALLLLAGSLPGAVVHVAAGAAGSGDGSSWADACPTLQAGLARAGSGDQVWIAQGTYVPGAARSSTFTVPAGVALYGGFLGGETALAQRRDDPSLVVLSGEIGAAGHGDNVTTIVNLSGDARLDTLTVSGASFVDAYSGNSWHMIGAGGLWARGGDSRVAVSRCRFSANRGHGPAVIYAERVGDLTLERVEVLDSREDAPPGDPRPEVATVALVNCSRVLVDRCVVAGVRIPSPAFWATSRTAAIRLGAGGMANALVQNTVVVDTDCAVAIEGDSFPATVHGCTLAGNTGGVWPFNSTLRGCILEPPTSTVYTFAYTGIVEGCWSTATQGDPRFADRASPAGADGIWLTADDGLRLAAGSPCVDRARVATATTTAGMPALDLLGTARPQGHDPDCGAYEYPTGNAAPTALAQTAATREDVAVAITLAGSDPDGQALAATITGLPANGVLLPTSDGITAAGPALTAAALPWRVTGGANRVLYRPAADRFGDPFDSFPFQVDDGALASYPAAVSVTVAAVNDAPTVDAVAPLAVAEDAGLVTVVLTGISAGTPGLAAGDPSREAQAISLSAASSDPALIGHPAVSYLSPGATAAITFAPLPDAAGGATLSITLRDDGGTAGGGVDQRVLAIAVTVRPVNDPPRMDAIADLTVPEDAAEAVVAVTGLASGPGNEAGQALTLDATSADPALATILGIEHAAGASTARVRLRLAADAWGSALVYVAAFDDAAAAEGGPASVARVCTVRVQPVDDAPALAALTPLAAVAGRSTPLTAANLRLSDPDGTAADALTLRIDSTPAQGDLLLSGAALAAGATFTQADIDGGRIAYRSAGGGAADAWTFTWSDGTTPRQGPATMAVTLAGAGVPTVAASATAAAWSEGFAPAAVAADALVTDPDQVDWQGGAVTVTIEGGWRAGDRLELAEQGVGAGQVSLAGSEVRVGGVAVGTLALTASPLRLAVALAGTAAGPAAAQAILRAVRFAHDGDDPGDLRTLSMVVNDGAAGASPPAAVALPIVAIDDPPTVRTTWLALPAGETVLARLEGSDPDGPAASWALVAVPALVAAELVDADAGLLRLSAAPGAAGSGELVLRLGAGAPATVAVRVSACGEPRPEPAGELPSEIYAGGELEAWVRFDVAALGGSAGLTFAAGAGAPPGLLLEAAGADTVHVRWSVPAAFPAPSAVRFPLIATDPATRSAGSLPVLLLVRPQPGGGG